MSYQNSKLSHSKSSTNRFGKLSISAVVVAAALALPSSVIANEKSEIEELKQQVASLSEKLDELSVSEISTSGGGLEVVSKDGKYSFEMGGRFQLDYDTFDGAYNAGNDGKTGSDLFPRRVRTYVEGKADNWDYKLLLDFSEGAEITMARLRYKGFKGGPVIKLGKIREDISMEALTSSKHITGISRSMLSNTMSPYFKYGVAAYQYFKDSGLRYAVGVYKGGSFGATGKDENDDLALSYTGRLTWSPIHNDGEVLHLGLWGSHRDMGGNDLSAKFARGEVRETNVRLVNYAAGGDTYAVDNLQQWGVEFAGVYGPMSLQAEYAIRDVQAVESVNDASFDGYYVTASYFITGESRKYAKRGVFSSPTPLSTDGAWEVFARMSNFDATSDTQGTEADVATIGVNYYLNKKMKFMANYLMSDVSGPGTQDLVGDYDSGNAMTLRAQYLF
ncbi:OprO/OprP family phosphate-selective porin [Shewanella violacea]|uniref:Phosphate-selective porin O and P family n=1 Tax=Shewanella violacea (strain JCM 10179 / CIP 106290 / LMG 19151 / DSS12) TaxID=637905 RepID=D4ZBL9_SHEVD|nr:porin [Shewanella violacea]BAJ03414.1 phosphate-selective porin O and P family [Shewanella violacea DSS12]